jgi:hypothetical protein
VLADQLRHGLDALQRACGVESCGFLAWTISALRYIVAARVTLWMQVYIITVMRINTPRSSLFTMSTVGPFSGVLRTLSALRAPCSRAFGACIETERPAAERLEALERPVSSIEPDWAGGECDARNVRLND